MYTTENDMTGKPNLSFRVTEQMHDEVMEYKRDRDMSSSDAMREITRKGLKYDQLERRLERMDARMEELERIRRSGILERLTP
jgi:hypothetical protein